ncbi:MAG: hypothetical protein IPN36_03530 [Bacteroidetes bacterium]|nr:hypothetical protein [Bacteroidota bacterium]MBL0096346.1 hypothetical protein [Bacteroidota bacterium]
MDIPQGILDFLVYLAPSLLVFLTSWLLVKRFLQRESALKVLELRAGQQKDMMPLRLQAYERLSIYLERISPNVLLLNQYEPGLTVIEFQQKLLETIRGEFEHNYAQQIYISVPLWTIIRNAKEEVARQVNAAASSLDPEAPAYQLSKKIFDSILEKEEFPTQRALNILKSEVGQLF